MGKITNLMVERMKKQMEKDVADEFELTIRDIMHEKDCIAQMEYIINHPDEYNASNEYIAELKKLVKEKNEHIEILFKKVGM